MKKLSGDLVSIIIPSHNESSYLLKTLQRVKDLVESNYECIVVVESNLDNSIEFFDKFSEFNSEFRLVINKMNPGPSGAIKTGIRESIGTIVVVLTADGSDDVSQIDTLVYLVERGVSLAAASRYMSGGQLVGSPLVKGLLSRIAGLSLFYLVRIGTRDATNNFRAYSRSFLESINIQSRFGFELGLELATKARLLNLKIAEIPTIWIERSTGESNFKVLKSIPRYLKWYFIALFRLKKIL